jgi:Rod binding domain-containing protein
MSSAAESLMAGVPVVNQALEPAWVRHGSPAVQKEYAIGQQFEQMLVTQLARSLTDTTGLSGEGAGAEGEQGGVGGGQAGSSVLSSMLPQALASGVANDGGLWLAAELTRQLQGVGTAHATTPSAQTQSPSLPAGPDGGIEAQSSGGSEA